MCEPNHSIIQYPTQDDDGNPTGTKIDVLADRGWIGRLKQKIKDWFHLSKMGFGHSEAIGELSPSRLGRLSLPIDTKYEARWWDRTVVRDGRFNSPFPSLEGEALECATEYAHRVSIGNLTLLRQFLETSIRKSERPGAYLDRFILLLTKEGTDRYWSKLKLLLGTTMSLPSFRAEYCTKVTENLDSIIKMVMGFTRKRDLLVPAWADDGKLWLPY